MAAMRILALETSERTGSLAAAEGGNLLLSFELNSQHGSAQSLAPAIGQLLADVGWRPADVQMVGVAVGPGSFTGIRVGVATAKTLAYAVGARVLGVNRLAVIAEQAPLAWPRLSVVIDAQRGQLFTSDFLRRDDGNNSYWMVSNGPQIVDRDEWLASLSHATAVSGPGLSRLEGQLPAGVPVVERSLWKPQAATLAKIAWRRHLAGERDDLWRLAPIYLRKSAAEEKWDQRQAATVSAKPAAP